MNPDHTTNDAQKTSSQPPKAGAPASPPSAAASHAAGNTSQPLAGALPGAASNAPPANTWPPHYVRQQPQPAGHGWNGGYGGAPNPALMCQMAPHRQRTFFTPTRADALLAVFCLVLGFLYIRWAFLAQGVGVSAFTLLFVCCVLVYARAKKITPSRQSWFWCGIVLATGLCYALWPPGAELAAWQGLLLHGAAIYWCGCVFSVLLKGKTGNFLPFDLVNLAALLPFQNFLCLPKAAKRLAPARQKRAVHSRALPVLAGVGVALLLVAALLPMLASADSLYFGHILRRLGEVIFQPLWRFLSSNFGILVMQFVVGIPVALWLCGLVAGAAHRRYAQNIDTGKLERRLTAMAVVPPVTVVVVLGALCVLYVVFIACQLPYFFSAFGGAMPNGATVYATYAREGFFELCRIAAINLAVLAAGSGLCRVSFRRHKAIRALNLALCALTLLVLATAFSKMGLYIAIYGLTQKRIMTCVFMLFLALVCGGVMVLQFRQFSIVRLAAVGGASLLCALCLCNMDYCLTRYNAARWQAGTLGEFDEVIAMRSGTAAAFATLEAYETLMRTPTADPLKLDQLRCVLDQAALQAAATHGTGADTLTNRMVRALPLPQPQNNAERERWTLAYYAPDRWQAQQPAAH